MEVKYKLMRDSTSNTKLIDNKTYKSDEELQLVITEICKNENIFKIRMGIRLSMNMALTISHQNVVCGYEKTSLPEDSSQYFDQLIELADRNYKFVSVHKKNFNHNILNIMPKDPCCFFEDHRARLGNFHKKLRKIIINQAWLIDYPKVASALTKLRDEVDPCYSRESL